MDVFGPFSAPFRTGRAIPTLFPGFSPDEIFYALVFPARDDAGWLGLEVRKKFDFGSDSKRHPKLYLPPGLVGEAQHDQKRLVSVPLKGKCTIRNGRDSY